MKEWISLYGLLFAAIILIPNIVFAITQKGGFENKFKNRVIEILEQVGRFGCLIFMVLSIPGLHKGFWFSNAKAIYICLGFSLAFLYCLFWIIFWKESSARKALTLSILPSALFLESGVLTLNIPLIVFSVIFAVGHIAISYKNAVL